jgi:hypothetical protein
MGLRLKIGPALLDRVLMAEGHIHGSLGQRPRNWDRDESFRQIYESFRRSSVPQAEAWGTMRSPLRGENRLTWALRRHRWCFGLSWDCV